MPFEQGKKKTGGRVKGMPNVVTRDLRETVRELVEGNAERIRQDIEQLTPLERVNAWIKLSEFVLPKLQRSEMNATFSAGATESKTWIIEVPVCNCDTCRKSKGGGEG